MSRSVLIPAFTLAAAIGSSVCGQTSVGFPDTPVGRRAVAFMTVFNAGDSAALHAFVKLNFAKSSRAWRAPERVAGTLMEDYRNTGGVQPRHIEGAAHEMRVVAQPRRGQEWLELHFQVESLPPSALTMIGVEAINAPPIDASGAMISAGVKPVMTDAEMAAALERYLTTLAAADFFSGAVILAIDGTPIFARAYGDADKRENVANRVDTKFNLGSMNKMFTAVAIAQLAERGKLRFEDPIITHVPDYPNRKVAEKVTIHHLLTHTSGMGAYWNDRWAARKDSIRTVSQLIPLFAHEPLAFEPGQRMRYSNSGFAVLGLIIERVSGMSYYDYVRQHIFEPAGMFDTDSYEKDKPVKNRAIGYTRMGQNGSVKGPRRANTAGMGARGGPAGGGYSTATDLLEFAQALGKNKLLSAKYTEILLTPRQGMGPDAGYAYGFGVHGSGRERSVGHNGGAPGINAEFRTYPGLGYTYVVLANYDGAATPVGGEIARMIAGTKGAAR